MKVTSNTGAGRWLLAPLLVVVLVLALCATMAVASPRVSVDVKNGIPGFSTPAGYPPLNVCFKVDTVPERPIMGYSWVITRDGSVFYSEGELTQAANAIPPMCYTFKQPGEFTIQLFVLYQGDSDLTLIDTREVLVLPNATIGAVNALLKLLQTVIDAIKWLFTLGFITVG